MEEAIKLIAKEFSKKNVRWAIGGSLMLKEYGIVETVNDIDLLIDPKDVDRVIEVMSIIGVNKTPKTKVEYSTEVFLNYDVLGIPVDVMSGFKINHDVGIYEFRFNQDSITKHKKIDDVVIPFSSIEEWYVAYILMIGRQAKVQLIEDYFNENGIKHVGLIKSCFEQELPEYVKSKLLTTIKKNQT